MDRQPKKRQFHSLSSVNATETEKKEKCSEEEDKKVEEKEEKKPEKKKSESAGVVNSEGAIEYDVSIF